MKYVLILLFAVCVNAQTMLKPDRASYWGGAAPPAGVDTWYYANDAETPSAGYTSLDVWKRQGDTVFVASAGTVDSVAVNILQYTADYRDNRSCQHCRPGACVRSFSPI